MTRTSTARVRTASLALVATLVATSTAGCTAHGADARTRVGSAGGADAAPDAADRPGGPSTVGRAGGAGTVGRVVEGTGSRLTQADRAGLLVQVTAVVDDWFEAAYLGGDYPRTDFSDAFDAFTGPARVRAREDQRLMSNAAVGTTTYGVRWLARRADLDVLAVHGRASGVTVRFRLGMARAGQSGTEVTERVHGSLFLTFSAGRWRVFGYDVQRGAVR